MGKPHLLAWAFEFTAMFFIEEGAIHEQRQDFALRN